ncbi:MAG TPA: M28 family peptidase [Acidimicrobiales bacterium]|nr:M28 family peptidase [Acidimicrobiales bacterium]
MGVDLAAVPGTGTIMGWIREVVAQGIRRPGYPADAWAEGWIAERFRAFGLERVRAEPIEVRRWEPTAWSLVVTAADGGRHAVDCFPLPYARPTPPGGLDLDLVAWDDADPAAVAGRAALRDVTLTRLPGDLLARAGSAPADPEAVAARIVDPGGTLGEPHILPFGPEIMAVTDRVSAAGGAAFVGVLRGYPGDSHHYYVPYDAVDRPLPAVWINESAGGRLRDLLAAGPARAHLTVECDCRTVTSHNVVGELAGADDEVVMIGSHHDGPWNSAVEDGSGIALVLAQAATWAAQPPEDRPHRLVFVLQGGHMAGGAGLHGYIGAHRDELGRVVLEVHLEHAALEVGDDGPSGRPVPRWWFTSRNPALEDGVVAALRAEGLDRSLLLAPDALGPQPTTDGGYYHTEGVPIVNFLAAPHYLFDAMDTLDKVDVDNLVPLTRAAARIVAGTAGISAGAMRAGVVGAA